MSLSLADGMPPNLNESSAAAQSLQRRGHQEAPEVEWLGPELDVGADDGLLRLPEPELLDELELELPEDDDALPEDEVAEPWVVPGRVRATAPATTTPATPTVAVVDLIRPSPRSRAATAWATVFRCEVLMAVS
jgi:hypothetical protein